MATEIQIYNPKAVSIAPKQLPALSELQQVSENTGCNSLVVGLIAKGVAQDNIRAMAKQSIVETSLLMTLIIEFCSKTYCGGSKTESEVYDEAVRFTMTRFGHLNPEEVKQAFALGAAGVLENVNMTTYYGLFTVGMLGEILAAYDKYRNRVVAELRRLESEAAAMEAAKRKTWDAEQWASQRLAKFRNLEALDYTDFSETDYNYFTKTGQLQHNQDEKRKAWEDARLMTIREFEADAHTELTTRKNTQLSVLLKSAAQSARDGNETEKFTIRRTAIAKQLLVMRWVETKRK